MTRTKKMPPATKVAPPKIDKKELLLELLRRDGGSSLNEITVATGWLPHSARAMLTGLRKKGFGIGKEKVGNATRYSIIAEPAA
jgi:DNA-binding IclR family transcriptional regulator